MEIKKNIKSLGIEANTEVEGQKIADIIRDLKEPQDRFDPLARSDDYLAKLQRNWAAQEELAPQSVIGNVVSTLKNLAGDFFKCLTSEAQALIKTKMACTLSLVQAPNVAGHLTQKDIQAIEAALAGILK